MIIRFFDWDEPRNVDSGLKKVEKGDKVIVDHEWGLFSAIVLMPEKKIDNEETGGRILRKANSRDFSIIEENEAKDASLMKEAKAQSRKLKLPMKIIDARISLDGSQAVIAFVADGRVDFRKLVKDLSSKFGKSVRLQQIGSRDEVRRCGGYGICGRELCCKKFHGCLKSISTDMARSQLIAHRGSDRISGLCGRLMCCLSYEAEQYEEMIKDLPKRGSKVKVGEKKGEVIDVQVLAGKLRIKLEDQTILTASKEEVKEI